MTDAVLLSYVMALADPFVSRDPGPFRIPFRLLGT